MASRSTSISLKSPSTRGHFGHLTTEEQSAFDVFKQQCATENLLEDTTSSGDDLKVGIYDDGTLLRFLRARRFNVEDAYKQYSATRSWRKSNGLIELYENIDAEAYEETRKLYTHWTGRRDKTGTPLYLFKIGQLTPSVMSTYNKSCASSTTRAGQMESEAMLRLFCTYDNLTRFVLPLCSAVRNRPDPEAPVTATNCIVDISGVGILQFLRLNSHMQAASTLATAHYPETLGRTYIIGAPSFFPTIWGWINKWFDPITVSKIFIVPPNEVLCTLSDIVDPINIPKKYGGQLDYEFGMQPNLDPEIVEMLDWAPTESGDAIKVLPIGPMRWVDAEDGKRTAIAVGSVGGVHREVAVMSLKQ